MMNVLPAIIATSINPFGRLPEQLRVFRQWRRLGQDIRTFNVEAEAALLEKAGVPRACIQVIAPEDTALEQSGKPIPRIGPILSWLERETPARRVALINSDIYPAARVADFLGSWLALRPAVALTREETPIVDDYDIDSVAPYRGGLDAFVFSPHGLSQVNKVLADLPVTEAMCFGVPGWDYLLGAVIESETVGGAVLDSGLLLHQSHETTYVDIKEFDQFRPYIVELAELEDGDFTEVAEAYANHIEYSCRQWSRDANLIRSMYFQSAQPEAPPSAEARRIVWELRHRLPFLTWTYRRNVLVAFVDSQLAAERASFYTLCNFFLRTRAKEARYFECLMAVLCGLRCAEAHLAPRAFPDGYRRDAALVNIGRSAGADPMQRRLEIAYLFGAELIDYGHFDLELFEDVALSCENDEEREVVKMIGEWFAEVNHAA